jgi:hypothetical protein
MPTHKELWNHEDELVNQRTTWLMASQSILFLAYAGTSDVGLTAIMRRVISPLGVAVNCFVLIGVLAAVVAQIVLRVQRTDKTERLLVALPCTIAGWVAAVGIPSAFLVAWICLL